MVALTTEPRVLSIIASWLFLLGTFNFVFPNLVTKFSWKRVRTIAYTAIKIVAPFIAFYCIWLPGNLWLFNFIGSMKTPFVSCKWVPLTSLGIAITWYLYTMKAAKAGHPNRRVRSSWVKRLSETFKKTWLPSWLVFTKQNPSPGTVDTLLYDISDHDDLTPDNAQRKRRPASTMKKVRNANSRRKYSIPEEASYSPARSEDYSDFEDYDDQEIPEDEYYVLSPRNHNTSSKSKKAKNCYYNHVTPAKKTRTGRVYGYYTSR